MFEAVLLAAALGTDPDPAALLRSADAPRQAFLHSSLRLRATIEPPDGPARTGEFDLHIGRDDQQLVVFRDPQRKDRKFLILADRAWLIVPGAKNPVAVTPNQRMLGAIAYTDIARVRLASDYTGSLRAGTEPCGEPAQPCRVMDITATTRTAPYASGVLWIDGDGLLRRAVYALASGKPAKAIDYRYRDHLGQTELSGMTLVDLLMPDGSASTVLEIVSRRPATHPAALFDPQQYIRH